MIDRPMLEQLQRETFALFEQLVDPATGLVADRTEPGAPASIAACGLGWTAYCVAAERGWLPRAQAAARVATALQFFATSAHGPEPDATGFRGLYYHFLDIPSGRRYGSCELSTIDTALLLAGALTAAAYFSGDDGTERRIRELADQLYRRADWQWACNGARTITHGWTPEHGFLASAWNQGYSEAMILYALALGSPTFPTDPAGYREWTATFERIHAYGYDYYYAGPLFIHQLSQLWLDCRGIRDDRNRQLDADYFENSRRATCVQQRYAIANPCGYAHYSENGWGFTASDGPGPARVVVDGVTREFFGYCARGAPFGPDDGTISPWAVVASLPFAPELVSRTVHHAIERLQLKTGLGFDASFNPTFPRAPGATHGWTSPWRFGLNDGPVIAMIENTLSELIWTAFKRIPHVATGLRRAGFTGGWLEHAT